MRAVRATAHGLRGRVLRGVALALLACFLTRPPPSHAEGDDAESRLSQARVTELSERNYERAIELYRDLLGEEALDPRLRSKAMLGLARCERALDQVSEARQVLESVVDDVSLPAADRETAQKMLGEMQPPGEGTDPTSEQERQRREQDRKRLEQAAHLVEEARRARDAGSYDEAEQLCLYALKLCPDYDEARALLMAVVKARPNQAELLRNLMRFARTKQQEAFLHLKRRYEQLDREGREAFQAGDYTKADERFRQAIDLIDKSDFFRDFRPERAHAVQWLRQTIEEGTRAGLRMGPEPVLPEPGSVAPSFLRLFYDALSRVFTAGRTGEDPLVLYDVTPAACPPNVTEFVLNVPGGFADGLSVTRSDEQLTCGRARWAYTWIRDNLGTGWTSPTSPATTARPLHLLQQLDEMLLVQQSTQVQARVRELLDSFADTSAPVAVRVAAYVATPAGGTRMASALGARTPPRGDGSTLIVPNRLLEECLPLVEPLEGVKRLGQVEVTLAKRPDAVLQITLPWDHHPVYQGLPPPAFTPTKDEARFGIWLDLYAEDLPRASGARRAALGLRVRTRVPTGTFVVPDPHRDGQWVRIAQPMAEQEVEACSILLHASTLLVFGPADPFPGLASDYPALVFLVSVRPAAVAGVTPPTPDPPRTTTSPAAPGVEEEREYDLGPLASEVQDFVLDEAWPRRPASVPLPAGTIQKARDAWLESQLGTVWTHLAAPGQPNPVTVEGRVAFARLTPAGHAELAAAVDRLRGEESTLYEVVVDSGTIPAADAAAWLANGGAESFRPEADAWVVKKEADAAALAKRLADSGNGGLYDMDSRLLARATQRVAATNLHTQSIVSDLYPWPHSDGSQREIPEMGTAEEGLVVLVRPDLEAQGRRLVAVEAESAKIQRLEQMRLPSVQNEAATVTVPRHAVERRSAAYPLADGEALLLSIPAPADPTRRIVVLVRTRHL